MVRGLLFAIKKCKAQQGLSLIELLVVVIILGILSGIAVLGLSGVRNLSELRACEAELANIKLAVTSFKNDYQPNPADFSDPLLLQRLRDLGYLTIDDDKVNASKAQDEGSRYWFSITPPPAGSTNVQVWVNLTDGSEPKSKCKDALNPSSS